MIQTKRFELTKAELFNINLQMAVKKSWPSFVLLPPVMVYAYRNLNETVSACVFIFGILFFLLYAYSLYNVSYTNAYPLMLAPRILQFTSLKIRAEFSGTFEVDQPIINELPINSVVRSVELKKYFLLYITKADFVVVPKDSFQSTEDVEGFKSIFFKHAVFKPLQ